MIFYRLGPPRFVAALQEILRSPDLGERAVARNIERDHRVSPERAAKFFAHVGEPRHASALRDGLTNYFYEEIRMRRDPAFLDLSNQNNFVSGFGESSPLVAQDQELARILDLNGLASVVYARARDRGSKEFADLPVDTNPDGVDLIGWLDYKLRDRSPATVRTFVEASLEAMRFLQETVPFQPSWVTYWTALERMADLEPVRWLEALGLARPVSPRWVIVLRYPVREAGTLVRPTQLDAGDYEFHFPSPPQAPLELGGHPMELNPPASSPSPPGTMRPLVEKGAVHSSPLSSGSLPAEYIHQQITHSVEQWLRGGSLCRRTHRTTAEGLGLQRAAHRERLGNKYAPAAVLSWMPEVL